MYRILMIFAFLLEIGQIYGAPIPKDGREKRKKFLEKYIKSGAVGAEIGVASGAFSYHFLLKKNPSKLFLIDPWYNRYVHGTGHYETSKSIVDAGTQTYMNVQNLFKDHSNVTVLRMKSVEASFTFEDNFFDYVYIDGEHTYRAVWEDLNSYLPKVKIGGFLIGDDYGWRGIKPAVQNFLRANRNKCEFVSNGVGQYVLRRKA